MNETASFTPERLERFHGIVRRYEVKASALLPTLYLAQEQFGFLSPAVQDYVAALLEIPKRQVYEAVSFYTMFRRKDMGRFCLQVCNNITCSMMGSEGLIRVIKDDLGIGPHEVTKDGQFSFVPVQCLGSCDTAPVVQVNETYCEQLSIATFRKLLEELRKKTNLDVLEDARS